MRITAPPIGTITLVGALLVQTCGIVWWAARIDQRMTTVEQKVLAVQDANATLARLDERTASLSITVNRIAGRMDAQDDAILAQRKP